MNTTVNPSTDKYPTRDQVLLKGASQSNHRCRTAIEEELKLFYGVKQSPILHRPYGDDACWPEVAELKDEGHSSSVPNGPTCDCGEKLR